MSDMIIGILFFISLFSGMLLSLHIGHKLSHWHKKAFPGEKHSRNKIIEGAIFALMGLLIAFTFSNAKDRFDVRRTLIIEEANAIETTYLRLGMLPKPAMQQTQQTLRKYLQIRQSVYDKLPHINDALPELHQSQILQKQIWDTSLQACNTGSHPAICIVLLPAINHMIDIANARFESTSIHPPTIILATLISLALLSALILGYSMRKSSIWHSMHVLIYAIIITFTIFVIVDLEYPHLGFLYIDYFNQVLADTAQRIS
jgi:hypothetical protein